MRFIEKLQFEAQDLAYFEHARLTKKVYVRDQNLLEIELHVEKTLPYRLYAEMVSRLFELTKAKIELAIIAETFEVSATDFRLYVDDVVRQYPLFSFVHKCILQLDGTTCNIQADNETIESFGHLLETFDEVCQGKGLDILSAFIEQEASAPVVLEERSYKAIENVRSKPEKSDFVNANDYMKRKKADKPIPLKLLDSEMMNIMVEGVVFDLDHITLSSGNVIETFNIYDAEDAISLKRFISDKTKNANDVEFKNGDSLCIIGDYNYDSYARENIFRIKKFAKIEPLFKYSDNAPSKRAELHAHTNFSEMDGVADVSALVRRAVEWGHPGLAITDHNVVQSFPKAFNELQKQRGKNKDLDFKLAYGIEMNMVDEQLKIVRNPTGQNLKEATYVIYDVETTGLSAKYDHMIEFGAIKVHQGQIVDRLQCFIKPPIQISDFTTELTSITQKMLDNADPLEVELPRILDFMKDSVLVAHNASFDYRFMRVACERIGVAPIENTVIDTLDLARAILKNRRYYRLGHVARHYKIAYDEDVAHRADYDAEVLANIFQVMLKEPELSNCVITDDLQNLSDEEAFKKVMKSHVNILAKNDNGLKKLYELVSLSHTRYLAAFGKAKVSKSDAAAAEPRILRSEIMTRRADFLIGSSCLNGEVFEAAANQTQQELEEAMAFYDYIEIQPLNNYSSLLSSGSIDSTERLQEILKNIYETAHKLKKLVVATGDSHYIDPHEKILREIYINSQGIGGVRHPLYIYNAQKRQHAITPNQHFRSTQEMLKEYPYLDQQIVEEMVVENPRKVLDQIEEMRPIKDRLYTPSIEGSDEKLEAICYENAHKIYGEQLPDIVEKRLKRELESIIKHGFGVIYYIAHLLVKKSMDDGYIVGSRGSVGSSFVATMANITEVNPLAPHYVCPSCQHSEFFLNNEIASGYDLEVKACPTCGTLMKGDGQNIPFETFLGFEADKVPDIDLNFSGEYQEHAHAYTKELFGEKYVYRAGTIGTVAQKTAFGYVSGYYENMNQTPLHQAWRSRLAMGCEGVKRTTGQHPGGIIVIPSDMDVHDFTPINYPANNTASEWLTTHFEFADIHDNVLKLDILGHVDPTATKMLERLSGLDIKEVNFTDPKVMSLFSNTDALNIDKRLYTEATAAAGLPEFGTRFVRRMLEATQPKTFSDLVQISGLSHGTDVWANNAEVLVNEKKMRLEDVIGCRDDIMTYLVSKGLPSKTSFDIMESVRKGKGLKPDWIEIMKENKVPEWYIDSCLKIKYMFPKAHAVAYVTSAVRIAWFKVYRPREYYSVYFTLRTEVWDIETMVKGPAEIAKRIEGINMRLRENKREVTNKEVALVDSLEVALEMTLRGYVFTPISLDKSLAGEFCLDPDNPQAIIPPFKVIDGLGVNAAQSVVDQRQIQPFISKRDLMERTSINQTLIKRLEELHVLDHLDEDNQLSLF